VVEPDAERNDAAMGWLGEVLGASVIRARSLSFGISSQLDLIEAAGERFVLRRYLASHLLDERPGIVSDEARVLDVAHAILGDVVPVAVAADPTGAVAGRPALVMTYLEGATQVCGLDPNRLVEPLTTLHAAYVAAMLPTFHHWYDPARARVPAWTTDTNAWARVVALAAGPEPASPRAFIHRDFHPGNLLWRDGTLSGIVDWAFACWGPRAAEVAHTRANFALVDGLAAADAFLAEYARSNPSYTHDPWWDAAELLTWDEDFSGVMAFNAFGAGLELEVVRARADVFARSVVAPAT
jgi:aminoglycoside phosphotransferase (APT) family kinase protein